MNILRMLKGLSHSTWFVASQHDQMTGYTAQSVVAPSLSLLKEISVAVANYQLTTGSSLTKEELADVLTRICLIVTEATAKAGASEGSVLPEKSMARKKEKKQERQEKQKKQEKASSSEKEEKTSSNPITALTGFLRSRYHFQYNILTRETEMRELDVPTALYTTVKKREENTLVLEAQEEGIDCWNADVNRIVNCTKVKEYHPFTQYFENLPKWDGKDRVTELARRISDNKIWVDFGCHRWMLAATAHWMNLDSAQARANCVAPLLISDLQGLGKSTICRLFLPPCLQRYYTESFDLSNVKGCEEKLADFGLINMDEFDKYTAKQMPTLKNLMQQKQLNVKRAYATTSTPLHRIASFIGTSNRRDLLVDKTGSRRFICLLISQMIDCETPIEYDQLYAQLKEELLSGARTYFNKEEEALIQENNRAFYRSSVEEECFYRHYRFAEKGEEGAEFKNATDIFKELKKEEGSVLRGVTAHAFCRLMPTMGKRVHTKWGNGYYVVRVD